jgi:hypothetical protein
LHAEIDARPTSESFWQHVSKSRKLTSIGCRVNSSLNQHGKKKNERSTQHRFVRLTSANEPRAITIAGASAPFAC